MSKDQFMPDDYELPVSGGDYLSFEQGDTKFRILSKRLVDGFIGWGKDSDGNNVPLRVPRSEKAKAQEYDKEGKARFFWVVVVWDYKAKRVKILELTQMSLIKPLKAYIKNEDWGHPKGYDLTVTKTGEKLDTEYQLTASPPKPISQEIKDEAPKYKIDLMKLFTNDDPYLEKPDGGNAEVESEQEDDAESFEDMIKDEFKEEPKAEKPKSKKAPAKKKAAETPPDDEDEDDDELSF